jgi:hypothetical protein
MAYSRKLQYVRTQLLVSKIHSDFNLRKKSMNLFCNPLSFYLPTRNTFALPYTSPYLAQNLLSDWLWDPLLCRFWAATCRLGDFGQTTRLGA